MSEPCSTGGMSNKTTTHDWSTINFNRISVPLWGWKYADVVTDTKLDTCLKRFGQHVALEVREKENDYELIDGRFLLAAMKRVGWERAMCVNVGTITDQEAKELALALEVRYDISYAALAAELSTMTEETSAGAIASCCPLTPVRINHMVAVASFDWPSKGDSDLQNTFMWGDDDVTAVSSQVVEDNVSIEAHNIEDETSGVGSEQGVLF